MRKSIRTPEHKALCTLLRDIRLEAGLTQEELAERLGKPQAFVSRYELGERRLDLVEIQQISDACGVSLREVLGRYVEKVEGKRLS